MATTNKHYSPVYRQLEAYQESWRQAHNGVKALWKCEDFITVGLTLFSLIERVHATWRDRVFRGVEAPNAQHDQIASATVRLWLTVAEFVIGDAAEHRREYSSVGGLEELEAAASKAREWLKTWQPPRPASAVGLREMSLSAEAAAELDEIVRRAKTDPVPMPSRKLEVRDAYFLKRPRACGQ